VAIRAAALNHRDVWIKRGEYAGLKWPCIPGSDGAGVVEAVGEGVTGFAPGDRVGTFGPGLGTYATERNVAAAVLVKLPDGISDEAAAASLLKGVTAEFLVERCGKVQPGWTVLVHAAAGGVGQILVQWLHAIGAQVIGTAGTAEKAETVKALGAGHVLLSREDDIAKRVREITGGAGVPVVFDGVGKATWPASLDSAARRGLIISYGNASGPVEGVNIATLNTHGSLFVTRPTMFHYYAEPEERAAGVARLFAMLESGKVQVAIGQRFRLEEAAEAHRAIEAGETQGSTVLIP